jgi:non-specific serine/threonine protein kinase
MTLQPDQMLSHYRLVEKIGEGGMGVVWSALDENLQRHVALKFLPEHLADDPEQLARLQNEARAIAALNHPNIVTIYEIDESRGKRFLAMERIDGTPLSDLIPEDGYPLEEILVLTIPLVDAISAAHEQGITHGDLKPRNIMVTSRKIVKVLDFGLARSLRRGTPTDEMTSQSTRSLQLPGHFSGTLPYMSPEQIRDAPPGPQSDIFALGVILYELATGERPFRGDTAADVIASILKDTPPPVTEIRPALFHAYDKLVRHCLQKELSRRMQSALDLRNQLEEIRSDIASHGPELDPSIAILPFVDMSAEKDQDYFCEGTAEEIINTLAQIQGLRVASRTSSFRFKQAAIDSSQIGRQLRVRTLLEGSVRKAGRQVRIAAQLTDAETGFQLWSERFDRELEDIFAIQEEIARSIVAALRLTLTPQENSALGTTQTTDVKAYDAYLRGRKFYYQYRRRGIEFALQMFSSAIELDPAYANAYAGIADCCAFLFLNVERQEAHRERALTSSRRALELAPDSAQVHASRGAVLSMVGEYKASEAEFETAIRLDPTLFEAQYFYARDCFAQGKLEKAARLFEQASRVRPEDYLSPFLVCQVYDSLGRNNLARESRLKGIRIAEQHLRLHPDDPRALYFAANAMVFLGDVERGLEWTRRAIEMEPGDSMVLYNVGCILSVAGQTEEAIDRLENAAKLGLTYKAWYEMDSNLDPLRTHPRFQALLQSLAGE